MTKETNSLIERLRKEASAFGVEASLHSGSETNETAWVANARDGLLSEAADRIETLSSECEALREGWQNAVFALEYWYRECRHAGESPLWADGPIERTFIEIQRHRAAIRALSPKDQSDE